MEFEKFIHENVKRDGTFADRPGAVVTDGCIRMSQGEGCGLRNCNCSEGHWISISMPRNGYGVVEGIKVTFNDCEEMDRFLRFHEVIN